MKWIVVLALAAAVAPPAQARTRGLSHGPHALHAPRLHKPRSQFRTVRVRRADGAVMTGYRDSFGTHLRGPDGRTVHCQRQFGGAEIDIACR